MAGMAQGGRGRRILGIAIIVVPWLLRDQLAVKLEAASTTSEQVQIALVNEVARQQQENEQLEMMSRLVTLEHEVHKVAEAAENDSTLGSEARSAGEALQKSVLAFTEHIKTLDIDENEAAKVHEAGDSATAAAQVLIAKYGKPTTSAAEDDTILAHFESKGQEFGVALDSLSEQETRDAKQYSTWATWSRIGAWIMTAIGAVMLGGWKALMRDVVGEEGTKADGER